MRKDLAAAEGSARTITDLRVQAEALAQITKLITGRDPATAEVLFADALHWPTPNFYRYSYEKAVR
ncbi:hypothetical protein CG740_38140 [Streptomyces sp. CB01201]|uniref:hypothetical protein n=1 Tax=Streptomyces sp. CB01201 TaxID=2020324 RepID=UPI000C27A9E2|nr:hypothetical protein [Streptomyces sp. CB01201]PJM97997.1 hypothetical protein CG740_38140 [Streptomyces sp. CB01201]